MFIAGGNYGWVIGKSTSGEVFGNVFPTYNQIRHFVGYWLSKRKDSKDFNKVYNDWYEKYINQSDEEFTGNDDDWQLKDLAVDLIDEEEATIVKKPEISKKPFPNYETIIREAVLHLVNKEGSTMQSIKKYIYEKYHLMYFFDSDSDKEIAAATRSLVKQGKIKKIGSRYLP